MPLPTYPKTADKIATWKGDAWRSLATRSAAADVTYTAALQLVDYIQARLACGRPFRTQTGETLTDLDQVVAAILADTIDLPFIHGNGSNGDEDDSVCAPTPEVVP